MTIERSCALATPTDIDRRAPVVAHHEVEIDAPLETVWRLHTDVNSWPSWNTDITAARLDGTFEPGESFDWTSYGFSVTSTIYEVTPRSRILWGGTAGGITGVHEWLFEETSGGVRVITNESFAGEPVQADKEGMQASLDGSLRAWLAHLKAAAEGS
jgi:uncharacterized protein YndB with AHSA1/START domain